MLFTTSTIALVAALLPATIAAPMQKRMSGVTIKSGRTGTCLSLPAGTAPGDGTLLTVTDCGSATKWDINYGSGSVVVTGTNYALDAGVPQGNNAPAKVWTSYPGSTQQTWYLTNDNRIAITGGNQCLDEGDNGPQTYQCTPGNTNQVWYVGTDGGANTPISSSTGATPTSASPSAVTTPRPAATPFQPGTQIAWRQDTSKCLTVDAFGKSARDGDTVSLQPCQSRGSIFSVAYQEFRSTDTGGYKLLDNNLCLDAQASPYNGGQLQVWTCYGSPQQTFKNIGNGLIQTSNNQCINVDNSNFVRMQTWECSSSDPNQMFDLRQ